VLQGHERSSTYGFAWAQPRVFNADVDVTTRAYQQVSCSKRLSSFDETGARRVGHRGGRRSRDAGVPAGVPRDRGPHAARQQTHTPPARTLAEEFCGVLVRRRHARFADAAEPRRAVSSPERARRNRRGPTDDPLLQAGGGGAGGALAGGGRHVRGERQAGRAGPAGRRREEKGHVRGGPLLPRRRRVSARVRHARRRALGRAPAPEGRGGGQGGRRAEQGRARRGTSSDRCSSPRSSSPPGGSFATSERTRTPF
jgi:hypothetical protein